jgi:NAD(P)H-flavin reductase
MCEDCGLHDGNDSIYLPEVCTLVKTMPLTDKDRFFEFKFDNKDLGHMPGQFAEISIPGFGEAPISISSSPTKKGGFEMVIRNVGKVTDALHRLKPGDPVGIRGPFGPPFPMDESKDHDLLFIAGGIGLVPLRSAINYALDNRDDYGKIIILFGCADPAQRLFTDELAQWAGRADLLFLETVDRPGAGPWNGNVGVITTLFPKVKDLIDPASTTAFIVGPPVMFKFVVIELRALGFSDEDILVSLERRMKCGVGKCGHCQIDNLYVCQDGPVFSLASIAHLAEAI